MEGGLLMRKNFVGNAVLLPLGYLVFAAVLFIGFMPDKQQNYPTGKAVRAAFDECYEEMDQVSRLL